MSKSDQNQNNGKVAPARKRQPAGFLDRNVGRDGTSVRDILRLAIFFVIVLAVTVGAVLIDWTPGQTLLTPGDIADQTYKAPQDASYVSDIRTEELKREAGSSVSNIVQTFDPQIRVEALRELEGFIRSATEIRESDQPEEEKLDALETALPALSEEDAQTILSVSDSSWETVASEATMLVDTTLEQELQGDEVEVAKQSLEQDVSSLLSTAQQQLAVAISSSFISPNVFIDDEATQARRQAAIEEVEPVTVSVKAGQAIVRDGDAITEKDIEALESLGLLRSNRDATERLGLAGMMGVLTIALVVYLVQFNQSVWRQHQLILVGIVVLTPVVIARLVLPSSGIQYMLPVAASAMLLAILIDVQFASVLSAIIALYVGVVAELSFELALAYFIGSLTGAMIIWRAERTMTFIWAGLAVAAMTFAIGVSWMLASGDASAAETGTVLAQALVGGALAASVTFLSFSVLGSLFGITTNLQLQELAHPRQPLLTRLAREAPGTYHHSIIVSNLAESAATRVDADPMFARVAVLYHDIGKIEHPTFFVENQANLGNVHEGLDPRVSAQIIIDHVRDGVKLARKARLPESIIDTIAQHHGTTRVEYFYRKALENDPDVDPEDFTYPGPKPQTREAAIIMLADAVEAAVRSMAQSGKLFEKASEGDRESESNRLVEYVHGIIQARIDDGQLDECGLTFDDVREIEEAFIQILEGIYHPRIEYPTRAEEAVAPPQAAAAAASSD